MSSAKCFAEFAVEIGEKMSSLRGRESLVLRPSVQVQNVESRAVSPRLVVWAVLGADFLA